MKKPPSEIELSRVFKTEERGSDLLIEPIRLFRGSEENERGRLKTEH